MKQSCRTCQHYDLESTKTLTGRVRSNGVAECTYRVPPAILPDSVTMSAFFTGRLAKRFMSPGEGTNCPCWLKLEAKK